MDPEKNTKVVKEEGEGKKEEDDDPLKFNTIPYISTPPKPTEPMVIKEKGGKERKPRVCLMVHTYPPSWHSGTPSQKETHMRFPIICLYQRMEYVRELFVGCDIELLLLGGSDLLWEVMEQKGWKGYTGAETSELCRHIQSQTFDFGLFMTIRKDNRDAGLGYGLCECPERRMLRAVGLASNANFLFGDWGIPNSYHMPENDWENLELSGGYDRNHYQRPEVYRRLHKYANGRIPHHARPFARLVRLDRFLRVVSSEEKELRKDMIDKIWSACRRERFSRANMLATWWAVKNGMCFAYDFVGGGPYEWKFWPIQRVQRRIAHWYMDAQRFYWMSFELEWAELFLRVADKLKEVMAVVFWVVFVLVALCLGYYLLENNRHTWKENDILADN